MMLRVLVSYHRRRNASNPYTDLLERSMAAEVQFLEFSWPRALLGRYDIFHVHWPEQLFRSSRPALTFSKMRLVRVLLWKIRLKRIPLVRTLHNSAPHELASPSESRLLRKIDRATNVWVTLNRRSVPPTPARTYVIPHGHYRAWFQHLGKPETQHVRGRLLLIGKLREYKGTEHILDLAAAGIEGVTFRIAGQPDGPSIRQRLEHAAAITPALTVELRYLSDESIADEIRAAEAVLLPYHRIENSGVALLALSLDRPVIAPTSATMVDLQREVGEAWVQLVNEMEPQQIVAALEQLRQHRRDKGPSFVDREWVYTADMHLQGYREALEVCR